MDCPYCGEELAWHDYYGPRVDGRIQKRGDIYKCENEECDAYEQHFYTDQREELHDGYPC
jgi:hypothetical protein